MAYQFEPNMPYNSNWLTYDGITPDGSDTGIYGSGSSTTTTENGGSTTTTTTEGD